MVAESINWPTVELLGSTSAGAAATVTVSADGADLQSNIDGRNVVDSNRDFVLSHGLQNPSDWL